MKELSSRSTKHEYIWRRVKDASNILEIVSILGTGSERVKMFYLGTEVSRGITLK